eukprot:6064440-Prorocentrum_lima.AAC.1
MAPWPTHAEAAAKLFKHHSLLLFDAMKAYQPMEPHLKDVTVGEMICKGAWVNCCLQDSKNWLTG